MDLSSFVSTEDDPRVVHEQRSEDYARHVVPLTTRVSKWRITMSYWALVSGMVWLFYGALIASLVGTQQALIALGISIVIYAVLNGLMTTWGTRTGLNSVLLSRRMFGWQGALLIALLMAAGSTYYVVFESSVLSTALEMHLGGPDIKVWNLIVITAVTPLMLGAVQTWMDKINGYLLPLFVVGLLAAVVVAIMRFDGSAWMSFQGVIPPFARPVPGWLMGVSLLMGIWLFMPTTVEFARQAHLGDESFHKNVSFGWAFYVILFAINGVIGIFLVQSVLPNQPAAETGVVQAVLALLSGWGLLLIMVTQIRIDSMAFYTASLGWERFITGLFRVNLPRIAWVLVIAVISYVLMLTDVFSYLQKALLWQGVFLVSWVGILVTHFAIRRSDRVHGPEFRPGRLPAVTPGLAVWVVSSALGIAAIEKPAIFGQVLSALAPVLALVASIVLYAAVELLIPYKIPARPDGDVRDQISDLWGTRIACHVCDRSYVTIEMDRDPAADGKAICAACAETNSAFLRAVRSNGFQQLNPTGLVAGPPDPERPVAG